MKKLLLLCALFGLRIWAQSATDSLSCSNNVRPGSNLLCTMSVTSGSSAAGLEFQISVSVPVGAITVAAAGGASTAGKAAQCNSAGLCLLDALNQSVIADGIAADITIPIPVNTPAGSITVTTSNTATASLGGTAIPTTANPPAAVSVLSNCDLNGDGVINAADVTVESNAILAIPQGSADRNGDGKTDVVDLQIVINAASGKGCTATQ